MSWQQHIDAQGSLLDGQPHIQGIPLSVDEVLARMSEGESVCDIMSTQPGVTWEDMYACFAYARHVLRERHDHAAAV